jgi:hypothetical protein
VIRRLGLVSAVVSLSVALAITAIALVTVLLVHFSSADRLIAVGDVFGGGIFLLAVVAAVVAVLAYADSSRRPKLLTAWSFRSLRDGSIVSSAELAADLGIRNFTDPAPTCACGSGDLVPLEPVKLELRVENHGEVAAKNVAVAFYLEGIYFSPRPAVDPQWRFFEKDNGWQIQWESGADRVVYPGAIPRTPSIELTGMWAFSEITHTDWGSVATFADDLKQPGIHPLRIDAASPP